MTDETKKLFDAPWSAYPLDDVGDANGNFVCSCETPKMAHRLARLPELYDALMDAARHRCWHCRHEDFPDFACIEDFEKNCKTVSCGCRDWWELLRKVRDGK